MRRIKKLLAMMLLPCTLCGCAQKYEPENLNEKDILEAALDASVYAEESNSAVDEKNENSSFTGQCVYTPGGDWPWDKANLEDNIWGDTGVNVLHSAEEIDEYCELYKDYFDFSELKTKSEKYDNQWFNDNVLIFVAIAGPSTIESMDYTVQEIRAESDTLNVSVLGAYYRSSGDTLVGMWHALIEIPFDKMQMINKINVTKSVYWPEDTLLAGIERQTYSADEIQTKMIFVDGKLYVSDNAPNDIVLPDNIVYLGLVTGVNNYYVPEREFVAAHLSVGDEVYGDCDNPEIIYVREGDGNTIIQLVEYCAMYYEGRDND